MLENDLREICKVYSNYLKDAHVDFDPKKKQHVLFLETENHTKLQIGVCVGGWFLFGKAKTQYYETFEGLMNDVSPEFRSIFANDLFSKLNALARADND